MAKLLEAVPLIFYDLGAIIFYFAVLRIFKRKTLQSKLRFLYFLCGLNFIAYIINDYYFYLQGTKLLEMMPLQLCNIAVFLIPLALKTKNVRLYDFAFYACAPGAFVALLIPSRDYINTPYSLMTLSFFIFHFMIVAIPFYANAWGIYNAAPSYKKAFNLSVSVFVLGGAMHLLNLTLNVIFPIKSDYFFTIIQYSAPTNPAFELFSKLIPYDFFYLLPAIVVLYLYMGLTYLVLKLIKNTGFKKNKLIGHHVI